MQFTAAAAAPVSYDYCASTQLLPLLPVLTSSDVLPLATLAAQGHSAPAYALSPSVPSLGSEYMFAGLGCGVVGVYSLATGA